jgi:hypothetical protein
VKLRGLRKLESTGVRNAFREEIMTKEKAAEETYNYDTFRKHMFKEDRRFHGGPAPGQLAPDFDLPTVDGGRFRLSDYQGRLPVLIQFGSIT